MSSKNNKQRKVSNLFKFIIHYFLTFNLLTVLISISTLDSLFAQNLVLKNISIYENETSSFSRPKNIIIKKSNIDSIEFSSSKEIDYYAIPTFCDVNSTITSDSLGGLSSTSDLETSLKSYLFHGVSHVLSVNNPKWFVKFISERKTKYPYIYFTDRSIINKSSEYPVLPDELYFQVENMLDAKNEIYKQINKNERVIFLLNRYFKESEFNFQEEDFREIVKIDHKNSILILSNFGEHQGILNAIRSEFKYLKDPIPLSTLENISTSALNNINYIPELNVYNNLMISENKQELLNEINFLSINFPFFKKYYSKLTSNYSENKVYDNIKYEQISSEYKSYHDGLKKYAKHFNSIFASGGAGNFLSFPGISLLRETSLISEALSEENLKIDSLYNTCNLLDDNYKGKLKIGEKANILLYKKNPLGGLKQLAAIEKIFIDGVLIKKPE